MLSNERRLPRFPWFALWSLFCAPVFFAQTCPHSNIYKAPPIEEVLHANSVEVIFRSAAITGDTIVPALLRLSKPGMSVDSIPGAAQVSLARLGDKNCLRKLEEELNNPNTSYLAYPKLVRVGTNEAVAMLMTYLRAHVSDPAPSWSDYLNDMRVELVVAVSEHLQIGPILQNGNFSSSPPDWLTWWLQNVGKPITLSISGDFRDPYLKCLARKVEWGFPDAIVDMARTRDSQVIPVLRLLARWGNPKRRPFVLTTLQGRAQLGLAQLGDPEELQTINKELDLPGFGSAIEELRQLGGSVAVTTLIDALDSSNFLSEYKGTPGYQRVVNEHNQAIEDALATMVIFPPETTITPETAKKWKAWWEKNKDTAQFVKPPVGTYE